MVFELKALVYILSSWIVTKSSSAQRKVPIRVDVPLNNSTELQCGNLNQTAVVSIIWQTAPQNKTLRTVYSSNLSTKEYISPLFIEKKNNGSSSNFKSNPRIFMVNESSFKILNTQMTDRGIWECTAIYFKEGNLENQLMSSYDINVISKPSPVTVETNILAVVKNGHASAYCDSQSLSPFSLTWEKKGGKISEHVSFKEEYSTKDGLHIYRVNMVIKNIDENDSGEYTCSAYNLAGKASETVLIKLKSKPIISSKNKYLINMLADGRLECSAKGYPSIDFTWEIPSKLPFTLKPTEIQGRYKVLSTTLDNVNDKETSVLIIKNLQRSDMSFFTCFAQNEMGKTEFTIEVSGIRNPEAPIILGFDTSIESVTLYWKLADNGGSVVDLIIIEYKKNSSETWKKEEIKENLTEYTISSLSERVTYDFRMAVSNSIGISEYTSIITLVTTNKMLTSSTKNNVVSEMGWSLIVIIGGVVVALACAGICIGFFVKSIHKADGGFHLASNEGSNTNPIIYPTSAATAVELEPMFHPIDEWEFPREKLVITTVLGAGAFGIVMSGMARGIKGIAGEVKVAVKIVRDDTNEAAKKDLIAELNLLKQIPEHENVIRLLGCCTQREPPYVIVEFCANGDLQGLLRSSRGIYERYYKICYGGSIPSLTSKMLLIFALQIAKGMSHLSSMKVIHRDLAARNILVNEDLICKVSDFGFARDIYEDDHYLKRSAGGRFPIKWMAIESLLDGISTTKSDVWAYGVLLWELITLGASPYPGMNSYEVVSFLQDGKRMDKPKHCSSEIYAIAMDCWNPSPGRRPSFPDLVIKFQKLIDESDTKEFINMSFYQDHLYVNFDTSVSLSNSSSYVGTPQSSLGRNRVNSIHSTVRRPSNPQGFSSLPCNIGSSVLPDRTWTRSGSNSIKIPQRPSENIINIEETELSERRDTGRSNISQSSESSSLLPKKSS